MVENVRFEIGEISNNDDLSRKMAQLCQVYVNDAFATSHRAQSSTHGVAKYAAIYPPGLVTAILKALKDQLIADGSLSALELQQAMSTLKQLTFKYFSHLNIFPNSDT